MLDYLNKNYSVILCDGQFPEHSIPLEMLNNATEIVCCDGAALKLLQYGKQPNAIVGDMDSLPEEYLHKYNDIIFKNSDQESNDQTKAVQWCNNQALNNIAILGATGKREDHTIGNISLLAEYSKFANVIMVTDTGIFVPINKTTKFNCHKQQQISIFAITSSTKISSNGLKYEISEKSFSNWYQGTLNETESNTFSLKIDRGDLIIYFKFIK